MTSTENPFKIAISDAQLSILQQKLALATFPDELEDAGWEYGSSLPAVKRLVNRWKDGYDWRKHEAELNAEMPQFTRDIEVEGFGTLNIHYVHKRSEVGDAIPLLFVHGWPGSFLEARHILPLLVQASPEHPSFHVVAISLPGFGFSTAPTKKGFELPQYAEVSNKLMVSLGYNEYVTQAGDWGYFITRKLASSYGVKHVKAWHTNFPVMPPPSISRPDLLLSHLLSYLPFNTYTTKEVEGLQKSTEFRTTGWGYYAIQSTKPQTLGYSLADSPVGLLAWIYEKLVAAVDDYQWDDDEVLTWISIYWFSRAGPAASVRIYREVKTPLPKADTWSNIPLGHSYFPKEILRFPRRWYKDPNLVFQGDHEKGGHFAAHERPEDLVGDLRRMFGKGGPAYEVVPGKSGYAKL